MQWLPWKAFEAVITLQNFAVLFLRHKKSCLVICYCPCGIHQCEWEKLVLYNHKEELLTISGDLEGSKFIYWGADNKISHLYTQAWWQCPPGGVESTGKREKWSTRMGLGGESKTVSYWAERKEMEKKAIVPDKRAIQRTAKTKSLTTWKWARSQRSEEWGHTWICVASLLAHFLSACIISKDRIRFN